MRWLNLVLPQRKAKVKASPAAEVLIECLRRGVTLEANPDGGISIYGPDREQIDAVKPLVEEHVQTLFYALTAFDKAQPPPTLAELH